MSGPFDEIWATIKSVLVSEGRGEVICASCVRPGDGTRPGSFGDYSVCPRCHGSVTSKTKAFFVPHRYGVGMDCYGCAVCRELAPASCFGPNEHHCSNAAIARVLSARV